MLKLVSSNPPDQALLPHCMTCVGGEHELQPRAKTELSVPLGTGSRINTHESQRFGLHISPAAGSRGPGEIPCLGSTETRGLHLRSSAHAAAQTQDDATAAADDDDKDHDDEDEDEDKKGRRRRR